MKAAMSPKARPAIRQPIAAPATAPPEIRPEDPSEDDGKADAKLVFDVDVVDVMPGDISPVPLAVPSASVELVTEISPAPASPVLDGAVVVVIAASAVAVPITLVTITLLPAASRSWDLIVFVVVSES
jgi:hypothetical protein